jgi:hypothetical protein
MSLNQDKTVTVEQRAETNLGAMLRCFMAMERWSMRKLAPEIGISSPTLHRVCSGYAMDGDTLLKVLNWMMRKRK